MTDPKPTDEDVARARKTICWAGSGLEIFRHKLALEFARVRTEEREACAEVADDEVGEPMRGDHHNGGADVARRRVAEKIRARGGK